MPPGTVITRFRLSPGVVSTTYAVMTLVTEPIGRFTTDDRDHRSAPVAALASSAQRDTTPDGAAGGGPRGGRGGPPPRYDQPRDHRTRGYPTGDPHLATSSTCERTHTH